MVRLMRNTLVYPLGIMITYQLKADPLIPNGFSIGLLWWSIVIWW